MNKKRVFQSVSAASILSLTLAFGSPLFAASSEFSDLGQVSGKEKIQALKDQGFIQGINKTTFGPTQSMTSAQGVQLIVHSLQLSLAAIDFNKAPTASGSFDHVKDGAWFSDAFVIAKYNGIKLPQNIDPSKMLTREQFTSYLMQAVEKLGQLPLIKIVPIAISDEQKIEPSYQGYIQRSLVHKINTLDQDSQFNPTRPITRAEAAVMTYNALEFLKESTTTQTDK